MTLMTKKKKVKTINLFNHKKCDCQKLRDAIRAKERDKVVVFLSASLSHIQILLFILNYKNKLKLHIELLNPLTHHIQTPIGLITYGYTIWSKSVFVHKRI
jgi:hypothetical protein